jgi:hypothetical protein
MHGKVLYRVVAPSFVAGLLVEGEQVVQAAPILRWAIGKQLAEVRRRVEERGGTVTDVASPADDWE